MVVLIVDDSALARMIVRRCFSIAGLGDAEFVEAEDGAVALTALRSRPVDLVIADLNMPNLDGEGLLAAMQADAALKSVPVVVCSSVVSEAREQRLRVGGARAVLSKPLAPAHVRSVVQSFLEGRV